MKITNKLFSYDRIFTRGQMILPAAEIVQVAELSLMKSSEISAHVQHCDEITYAISGTATVTSGDREYEMQTGDIHYIKKGMCHRIVADPSTNFRYFCIGFHPNAGFEPSRVFLDAVQTKQDFLIPDTGNLGKLFPLLMDEFQIRDDESHSMIHFYFCQMLIQLYRMLSGKSREKLSKINSTASNVAVYRAVRLIDREYVRLRQVREIAEKLSYSECYLSHVFREKMDMTVKAYLQRKKLMAASELLESSSMTVTAIADHLGFSTLHSFEVAFKQMTGLSPTRYRAQTREQF